MEPSCSGSKALDVRFRRRRLTDRYPFCAVSDVRAVLAERKAPSTPTGPASKSPGLHSPGYVADTRLSTPDSAQAPEEDENIKVLRDAYHPVL